LNAPLVDEKTIDLRGRQAGRARNPIYRRSSRAHIFLRGLANANAAGVRRAHGAVVKTGATQHSK
jgi:hypothetical protein